MKTNLAHFTSALLGIALAIIILPGTALGQGFTDSSVTFYGEVRQVGGAQTVLLQSGTLEVTFVNQSNPSNAVTLQTSLRPTGSGEQKPYSYALQVPLAYLPEAHRIGESLSIGSQETDFRVQSITVNGSPATLPDGSKEFYGLSFSNRAEQYRLDLIVVGDSTDTDGDGLPDWWEARHGLDPNLADANGDLDGDGWSNKQEFLLGSNPAVSNRDPQLATLKIFVPESGVAGCLLQIHDSDTAPEGLNLTVDATGLSGIALHWDGAPVATELALTAADLLAGRLTIQHRGSTIQSVALPLTWNDGGEDHSGSVLVQVATPSTNDGNDASLWLDANSLPTSGAPVVNWTDRSGNNRGASQPLADHQPVVTTVGAHHAVHFQSATSHLFFQDPALPTGDHTVFVSYQSEGTPSAPQVLMSSNRGFLRLDPTAQAISYPGAPHYQIDGVAVRGYESTLTPTATSIFRREGSTLQNIFGLSFNGIGAAAESLDPMLPTLGARRLALPVPDPIQDGFRGTLHELLVFPIALPEQKLRDVHDYLESKWAGAIVWDLSTQLPAITLSAAGPGRHIIRGGHGADQLRGGESDNTISGGPGDDLLTGNTGVDRFVYGGVDTGSDVLVDFDLEMDIIDFSALFWGESGDARQFVSTRLDTNFDGPIPTLDTTLIIQRPDATVQEIVLRNSIVGETELITLLVEGRIRMGGLSIPTEVGLALASGSEDTTVLQEELSDSFTIEVTRSGDGVSGALEVPVGLFQDALGHDLLIEGSTSHEGQRAVVTFDRGETSKLITVRPVPDLETEGVERWETALLPNFRYTVTGTSATRSISDEPMVTLAVLEDEALVQGPQAAIVRVIREGSLTDALSVSITLNGSALEGVHLAPIPDSLTIPAGKSFVDLPLLPHAGWDGAETRIAVLKLIAQEGYHIGHPHEAAIYAGNTATDLNGVGFDRWLSAATTGTVNSIHDLLLAEGAPGVSNALRAYAFGDAAANSHNAPGLSLRIVDNQPEITTRLQRALPDLHWQVQDRSTGDTGWTDVSSEFSEELIAGGMRFLGAPLDPTGRSNLYRLALDVDSTSGLAAGADLLGGTGTYGMRGATGWQVNPASGNLVSVGGVPSESNRLLIEVKAPTLLDFEMAVTGGDGSDLLTFFIDGVEVAQTSGDPVRVSQELNPIGTTILMWEFVRSTGNASINTAPALSNE